MPVPEGTITTTTVWMTPEAVQEPEIVEEELPDEEVEE